MKNSKLVLAVLMLTAVSSSCKLLNRSSQDGVASDYSKIASQLPAYDPTAPPPSPGAAALRRLAVLEPRVAALEPDVEAAERAALKTGLTGLAAQRSAGIGTEETFPALQSARPKFATAVVGRSPLFGTSFPLFAFLQGQTDAPVPTATDSMAITLVVSGWNDMFTPDVPAGANVKGSGTETEGGATSKESMNLGRNSDGSTSFGIGIKTEASKNGVTAKTDVSANLEGQRCPNSEGQVSFTMKMRLGAETGGAGYTQDLTAFVRAVVNDDAQVETSTMDLVQGTRQFKGGSQVYIESGGTVKRDGGRDTESNFRIIRNSQQATAENARPLSEAGLGAAHQMGTTALVLAERNWRGGGCTMIKATSPGTVRPSSSTAIPVTVSHKFDGSEVPSKLETVLKGEKSVDPTSLAKTAGTLTYTAPNEKNKSATISLTATSRRGRATLDLNANTGGTSYRIAGVSNGVSFTGEICSLNKQFYLDAQFPGGTASTTFMPGTDAGGTTNVSGNGGGCEQLGGGTYKVTTNADGSATLTWTTTDKLACPGFSNSRTATFTLPLQPAPEISCP